MTTMLNPTSANLALIADFDNVFAIIEHEGEITATDRERIDAPELGKLHAPEAIDPSVGETHLDGWELPLSGFTGQYGYSGPWLHDSELIEGAVGDYILEHPGYWVSIYASYSCEECGGAGLVYETIAEPGAEPHQVEVDCPLVSTGQCEPGGGTIEGWTLAFKPFGGTA